MANVATIHERDNGFPGEGAYVPGDDGELYLVVSTNGRIHTGAPGTANYIEATVELADWSDCDEGDEFRALAVVGAEVAS